MIGADRHFTTSNLTRCTLFKHCARASANLLQPSTPVGVICQMKHWNMLWLQTSRCLKHACCWWTQLPRSISRLSSLIDSHVGVYLLVSDGYMFIRSVSLCRRGSRCAVDRNAIAVEAFDLESAKSSSSTARGHISEMRTEGSVE